MARNKEFSPDQVINKAMALFRLRGYEATSVDDLVKYVGIGRGSLYATFGNKHALYLAALDRYLQQNDPPTLPEVAVDARAMVSAILQRQVDLAIEMVPLGGCLLVNSAAELAHDPEVAQRVKANLTTAERMFCDLLSRDPSLNLSETECTDLARLFVTTIVGLRLTAKITPDRDVLLPAVNAALRALP